MKKWLMIFLFLASSCFAAQDVYQFKTPEQQSRFDSLTGQLRCLVCQNQTIAESNASLAQDLREQIYQKVQSGQSDQAIVDYLVARYGDFILYRPPFNFATLGLWLGPILLLLSGLTYLIFYIRKQRRD
jgi:cytochrome c-type biogenesis protein CcmH